MSNVPLICRSRCRSLKSPFQPLEEGPSTSIVVLSPERQRASYPTEHPHLPTPSLGIVHYVVPLLTLPAKKIDAFVAPPEGPSALDPLYTATLEGFSSTPPFLNASLPPTSGSLPSAQPALEDVPLAPMLDPSLISLASTLCTRSLEEVRCLNRSGVQVPFELLRHDLASVSE